MSLELDANAFRPVAQTLLPGASITSIRRLTGGVSADVHAVTLTAASAQRVVVVRQHGAHEWKAEDQDLVGKEFALFRALHGGPIPVPEPLCQDVSGRVLPAPFLVMAFVEGTTKVVAEDLPACLDQMTDMLLRIHGHAIDDLPKALPERFDPCPELYEYLPDAPRFEELRERLAMVDTAFGGAGRLLHGDYWPENLMWSNGKIAAVLDWEDAAIGDPHSDLAAARQELFWKYGEPAMNQFTERYARTADVDAWRLHLWQVFVGMAATHFMHAWGLDPDYEAQMRAKVTQLVATSMDALLA